MRRYFQFPHQPNTPIRGVWARRTSFSPYYLSHTVTHILALENQRYSAVSERGTSTSDGMLAFRVCNVFSMHFANARNEIEPNKTLALALAQTSTATHCVFKSSCARTNGGEYKQLLQHGLRSRMWTWFQDVLKIFLGKYSFGVI